MDLILGRHGVGAEDGFAVQPDCQRVGCLPELVGRPTGRFALAQTSRANGGERFQRLVEHATQFRGIGKHRVKLIARDRVGPAIRKRALERHHQRGILAFGWMIGREYHAGVWDEFERVLEFVLGHDWVAAGYRLEYRCAGQVVAGKVWTNVRQPANEARGREPIILQFVEADRSDIALANQCQHGPKIGGLAVGAVSHQKYGLLNRGVRRHEPGRDLPRDGLRIAREDFDDELVPGWTSRGGVEGYG